VALLELRGVEAGYGPVAVVRGVSLDVEQGSVAAVLGANGAGKTTLLRAIAGALAPSAGSIRFDGAEIGGLYPWQVASLGIAHVAEGRELFRELSVVDNLRMGAYLRRGPGWKADVERVLACFPTLAGRGKDLAGNLSGGEQQMLAIGRALMARPRLVLLDEPSLGLSPLLVREIYRIIVDLKRERGVSMLLVEQNARAALRVAEHAYVLEGGRIALHGPADQLGQSEQVRSSYLGSGVEVGRAYGVNGFH
jgi:branched-chain amino acid transport system ATP-binding protein